MQKLKRICVLVLSAILILGCSFSSYADLRDLMIVTDSNALMTLELDDSDYMLMSPKSSVGTVINTIGNTNVIITYTNGTYTNHVYLTPSFISDRFKFSWSIPDYLNGYWISVVRFVVQQDDGKNTVINGLPRPSGNYDFSFDFSSDFSYELVGNNAIWESVYKYLNSTFDTVQYRLTTSFASGDIYVPPVSVNVKSGYYYNRIMVYPSQSSMMQNFGGSYAMRFVPTDTEGFSLAGDNISDSQYYEDSVSSSLSDLSSSVDSMTEDLSSAAENLEYISTSQNLIIQGIDNVVMHISDQLFAFWNQLYNLIHVPTMAKMDDIIDAIRNMDLEIEVNLDGLKQSIHQASQNEIANDNKVSADQIANDEANTEEVKEAVKEHGNFIIDGLKGLFIPSDEFFKAYFDDLYAYFSDRFGFLSFPIDLVIRIADLFLTSEKVDAVLTLPSFEISGYRVWDDYSFNFTEFLETSFPFLISAIQTVTSIGLIMAFVNLCQDKWNEVMRS